MSHRSFLTFLMSAGGFALLACSSSAEGDADPENTSSVQSAQLVCTALCLDGYQLTRQCTCEPIPTCTSTALCVAGYHWDTTKCQCVRDRR